MSFSRSYCLNDMTANIKYSLRIFSVHIKYPLNKKNDISITQGKKLAGIYILDSHNISFKIPFPDRRDKVRTKIHF